MKTKRPETIDESAECEIAILPDGRIYAFGITRPIVEVLSAIPTGDDSMRKRLELMLGSNGPADREASRSQEPGS